MSSPRRGSSHMPLPWKTEAPSSSINNMPSQPPRPQDNIAEQPQHWVRAVTSYGKAYWYSRETNQTRWTDPTATAMNTAPTSGGITAPPSGGITAPASGGVAPVPVNGTGDAALVWRKATASDGRVYYYNRVTKTTRWDRPPDFDVSPAQAIGGQNPPAEMGHHTNANLKSESMLTPDLQPKSTPASNSNPQQSQPNSTTSTGQPTATQLAPGWVRYTPRNGRPYYYHAATRQTRWQPPSVDDVPSSAGKDSNTEQNVLPAKRLSSSSSPQPIGQVSNESEQPPTHQTSHVAPHRSSSHDLETTSNNQLLKKTPANASSTEQWLQNTTDEGRVYYYNTSTRETSWTIPPSAAIVKPSTSTESANDKAPNPKRARTSSPIAVRPAAHHRNAGDKQKKQAGSAVQVRRPRDDDGKPLTDRAAEKYFLNRAAIRQTRNRGEAMSDINLNVVEPDSGTKQSKNKDDDVKTEELMNKAVQGFYKMLKERGMTASSSWLHVMAKCTEDARYKAIDGYGRRKDIWERFKLREMRANRREAILNERKKKEAFVKLLHESFDDEPFDVRSIHHCRQESVRAFEANPLFRSVDESDRKSLAEAFFTIRKRKGLQERKRRREKVMRHMSDALRDHIDPSLLDEESLKRRGATGDRDADEQSNANGESEAVVKSEAIEINVKMEAAAKSDVLQHDKNHSASDDMDIVRNEKPKPVKEKIYFNEQTSFGELESFLSTLPGFDLLNQDDTSDLVHDLRRHVKVLVEERRERKRKARSRMQHENRSDFRTGVLNMLLKGLISFSARWKDVSEIIAKEPFAKPEPELGCRPATLFEEGRVVFEERVQKQRDKFKQLLKVAGVADAVTETTVDKLMSEHEPIAAFAKTVERPVIEALLVDRQRKENKRRLKERERLSDQFSAMLRDKQVSLTGDTDGNSSATGNKASGIGGNSWNVDIDAVLAMIKDRFKDDKVYMSLVAVGGEDAVKIVVDQYVRWKTKEERKKRKLEQHGSSMSGDPSLHGGHSAYVHHPHMVPIGHGHMHPLAHPPPPPHHPHPHANDRAKRMRMTPPSAFGPPPPPPVGGTLPPATLQQGVASQAQTGGTAPQQPGQQGGGVGTADDENGWSAVVSEKVMTEEEKLAEKERRKREILGSLGTK